MEQETAEGAKESEQAYTLMCLLASPMTAMRTRLSSRPIFTPTMDELSRSDGCLESFAAESLNPTKHSPSYDHQASPIRQLPCRSHQSFTGARPFLPLTSASPQDSVTMAPREKVQETITRPLMSLPPEILNEIYKLVFGSHTIRFCSDALSDGSGPPPHERLIHYICRHDVVGHVPFHQSDIDCWHSCRRPSRLQPDTNILYACRKTWADARTFSYSENTFSFKAERDLRMFLGMYESCQGFSTQSLHAIHRINLDVGSHSYTAWKLLFPGLKAKCTNIRYLTVKIGLDMTKIAKAKRHLSLDLLMTGRERMILSLSGLKLKIAEVELTAWQWVRPEQELRVWSSRIERSLLKAAE